MIIISLCTWNAPSDIHITMQKNDKAHSSILNSSFIYFWKLNKYKYYLFSYNTCELHLHPTYIVGQERSKLQGCSENGIVAKLWF